MTLLGRVVRLPVVHFLACLIAGSSAQRLLPLSIGMPFRIGLLIGSVLLIAAFALGLAALMELRRHRTTVEPGQRPTALVKSGIFAFSRNPIYVALLLLLLAIAVMADSVWLLAAMVLLWILLTGVIRSEERILDQAFAEHYADYKRRVRRWL